MSKIKISDMTRQLCESAQELLQNVTRQQQAWRSKAQGIKRVEGAMQKAAEEAAAARAAAQEAQEEPAQTFDEAPQTKETIPAPAIEQKPEEIEPAQKKQTEQKEVKAESVEAKQPEPAAKAPKEPEAEDTPKPEVESEGKVPKEKEAPKRTAKAEKPKEAAKAPEKKQTETGEKPEPDKTAKRETSEKAEEPRKTQDAPFAAEESTKHSAEAVQPEARQDERAQGAQGDSVNEEKNDLQQETQKAAQPKVLDFRTKESRERAKPQQPRTTGPVYISKPEPGAQPAASSERRGGGRDRDRNAGAPRMQSARPAQGGAPRSGGMNRSDAPRGNAGGFGGQRSGGGNRRGGGLAPALPPTQEKRGGSNYDPNKKQYAKKNDSEKQGLNRRAQRRMTGESMNYGEEDGFRGRKKKNKNKAVAARPIEPTRVDHAVMATERISVKDLSEKIGRPASEIIKKLFLLGIMATINNDIDFDTAQLVCDEFGVELEQKIEKTAEEVMLDDAADDEGDDGELVERPPVVTIMGHVDHGKTSLLDRIRKSHVTATEAGGITQHIGAYTVTLDGRKITFLDTPGHEAFTAMRARGAQATDIAVLVVAADDGIMPQTIEAINHAKAAGVAVIVAINKIDRPNANIDRVMQQLTEYNLVPEEWGGDTVVVPVSAHTGENIDKLLEMILLVADVLELRANPARRANGIIIEARLDKGRGPVATVLVKNGTLHVGDTIVAGTAYGRVRAMQDDKGARVLEAGPSDPVEVVGFSDVPEAGDNLYAVEEGSFSRQVAEERRDRQKAEQIKAMSKVSLDDLFSQIEQGNVKELNVIVKADVQGSVEAVRASLEKISNAEVRVRAIHGGVGAITPTDVMLASASNAIIVGFNVRPQPQAKEAAEQEKVDIRLYRVIYQAIEDIENAIHGMLAPVFKEVVLGHVDVREVYRVSKVGTIAGGYVTDGKVTRNASVRLIRDGVVVHEGEIASLRRFKDDVREVASGYECGISLVNYNDIKQGDQLEAFTNEQVEA